MVTHTQAFSDDPGSTGAWDVVNGFRSWRLWAFMGLQDIRQRYRRSSFGPLWLVLGLGVTVFGIGLLYSQILKTPPGDMIPFIAVSLLMWTLLSTVIGESTTLFQAGAGVMTAMRVPYTTFVLRCLTRNGIIFAHNIIVVIVAFAFYRYAVGPVALLAVPGLVLVFLNLYWLSLCVGLSCLRYRDLGQIVTYVMQLMLFITPIIWMPSQLGGRTVFTVWNPFYHFIEVVRGPLFDGTFPINSFVFCLFSIVIGGALTLALFAVSRRHMIYWV